MNAKQKKTLFVCLAIVIGSFVIRSMVNSTMQMIAYQRIMRERAKRKPPPPPPPPPPGGGTELKNASTATISPAWAGVWQNHGILQKGVCDLRVELGPAGQDEFNANARFSCIDSRPPDPKSPKQYNGLRAPDADAALLHGKVEDGSIRFKVVKAFGSDIYGCPMTSFTLTPFGVWMLMAEWQDGDCGKGELLLGRAR